MVCPRALRIGNESALVLKLLFVLKNQNRAKGSNSEVQGSPNMLGERS